MFEMILLGVLCAMVAAWAMERSLARPPNPEKFDETHPDTVPDELESQEKKE